MSDTQFTRLGKGWLTKQVAFLVLLVGFGAWGLLDALVVYPERGRKDASLHLRNYLDTADKAGRLSPDSVKIPSLRTALAALDAREADLRRAASNSATLSRDDAIDLARLEWLHARSRMWDLSDAPFLVLHTPAKGGTPARSVWFNATDGTATAQAVGAAEKSTITLSTLLSELIQHWNTNTPAAPLSNYDMLVQWVFVVLGFGGGAIMLLVLLKSAATKFRWEAGLQRLTLPGGAQITPADLKEVDKRKWHKYYVTLLTKEGRAHKLDLYRFSPLEEWVLALEAAAFPDLVKKDTPEPAAEPAEASSE